MSLIKRQLHRLAVVMNRPKSNYDSNTKKYIAGGLGVQKCGFDGIELYEITNEGGGQNIIFYATGEEAFLNKLLGFIEGYRYKESE